MNQVIHEVYKIKHKETGLFSRGGTDPRNLWTKEGKSWSNIGHLKNHLNQYIGMNQRSLLKNNSYENAEIVKVEVNYDMCFKTDVMDMMSIMIDKKVKAEEEYQDKVKKWHEERERKQLEELKRKYE
ncbi:hypothetical protein [Brevibacillus reuszeri]|nr:hypothetical protein [Brevibacillus reuszeri]